MRTNEQSIISILKNRMYEDSICNKFCPLLIHVYIGFVFLNYFGPSAWLQVFHDRVRLLKIELIIPLLKLVLCLMAYMHMWEPVIFHFFHVVKVWRCNTQRKTGVRILDELLNEETTYCRIILWEMLTRPSNLSTMTSIMIIRESEFELFY